MLVASPFSALPFSASARSLGITDLDYKHLNVSRQNVAEDVSLSALTCKVATNVATLSPLLLALLQFTPGSIVRQAVMGLTDSHAQEQKFGSLRC